MACPVECATEQYKLKESNIHTIYSLYSKRGSSFSEPASNTIASVAESSLVESEWLVSLGDVACSADAEEPPSSGHSSDCQLQVYSLPSDISVSLPHTVPRHKARRQRRPPLSENAVAFSPISSSSELSSTQTPSDFNNELEEVKIGLMNIRSLSTKVLLVKDQFVEHGIDFLGLCET